MLNLVRRRKWMILGGLGALLALIALTFSLVLAMGPMDAPWLARSVRHALESQVHGGRASIERVRVAWFEDERALGLSLDGVRLVDGRGREVLAARRLEAGIALDSLTGLKPAVGRFVARDMLAAISISPRGEYALGYDASGVPEGKSAISGLIEDLTGRSRFRRPASYLRNIDVENARLVFRQVGGPVAWNARIATLRFQKLHGRLTTRADLTLDDGRGGQGTVLQADGSAAVGLSNALLQGRIEGLVPARVFPTVGALAPLSSLDAVVNGHGSISYDFRAGVRAADMMLDAGKGAWRMGSAFQSFESAELVANFDPASGDVVLRPLLFSAERTKLDLSGRFHLTPQDTRQGLPARLDFSLAGPQLYATLAADSPPQALSNVRIVGRYTPERRRFELIEGGGTVDGVPVRSHGVFTENTRGQWGAKFFGQIGGVVTPQQVLAFWPHPLVSSVRDWLRGAVLTGRLANATFVINAAPGDFGRPALHDENLRISFDFTDATVRFAQKIPAISAGVGRGVVLGNRFDLSLVSGRMQNVQLSQGSIEIAKFKPDGGVGKFKAHARGDAHEILTILDKAPLNLFTSHGFSPDRVSGDAEGEFEIDRPMLSDPPVADYRVRYQAAIHHGGLKEAALGWDLVNGEMKVEGDEDKVAIKGVGTVGPYRGAIDFATRYQGSGDHAIAVNVDGAMSAQILGGQAGRTAPFGGRFRYENGEGLGVVHSSVFDGRLNWKDGDGANRVELSGWGAGQALRGLGTPFMDGMPGRFPLSLTLSRTRGVWKGPLRADALSGTVAFVEGAKPRLVYEADISPVDAQRLGLSRLPLFDQPRRLTVDSSWAGTGGTSLVRAGGLGFQIAWNEPAPGQMERRLKADFSAADFAALGLPSSIARPGANVPVEAVWKDAPDGAAGTATIDGVPVRFQSGKAKGGAQVMTVRADLNADQLRRLGAPALLEIDGASSISARIATVDRAMAGRVDLDLGKTTLSVLHSDWRKPAGQNAHLLIDFAKGPDGFVRLTHLASQGPGVDLDGSAVLSPAGKLMSADLPRLRLSGLLDTSLKASREGEGMTLVLRGRSLDARRMVDLASEPATPGSGPHPGQPPLRIDAVLDNLRLTDDAVFRDVHATGVWAGGAVPRLDVSALTAGGAKVSGRVAPEGGVTTVVAQTSDAGEMARSLFGVSGFKGGTAEVKGRLVEGGADMVVEMKNVRVVKAPAMAQLLTMASLRGLADTLNGEGVLFTTVKAPIEMRGCKLMVGESRASGSALGLTTKGVADLASGAVDFQGVIVPAYGLNSVVGHVPVLGQILTSRKGEGVLGISYSAKGSIDKPQIAVNPLSLITPGILRRMFEAPIPAADRYTPPARPVHKPSTKAKAAAGA